MLVYFHGGGMVMGSNHSFEPLARTIAAESTATVVSVDYRLAPESRRLHSSTTPTRPRHGSPTTPIDSASTSTRLAVVGDSAGGSLAAAVALAARDHGGPAICCQVLLYPGLDRDMGAPSITALTDAPMLWSDDIVYMHDLADNGAGSRTTTTGCLPTRRTCPAYRPRSS